MRSSTYQDAGMVCASSSGVLIVVGGDDVVQGWAVHSMFLDWQARENHSRHRLMKRVDALPRVVFPFVPHAPACPPAMKRSSLRRPRRGLQPSANPSARSGSRSGAVLCGRDAEPALDCGSRRRRAKLHRHLAGRAGDHLSSAGAVRDGAFVALSRRRRHVCLEQARVRRLQRIHHRLGLLDEQSVVLSRPFCTLPPATLSTLAAASGKALQGSPAFFIMFSLSDWRWR